MAGLVGLALGSSGFSGALAAFGTFTVVVVLLMFAVALTVAGSQGKVTETLQSRAPDIKRWGGIILIIVGLWMLALGLFADFFSGLFPV